jgi:uncharacterized membrane protein YfcA
MLIFWVLGFSLLGSIGSIAGAALLLVFPDAVRRKFVPCLISYAMRVVLRNSTQFRKITASIFRPGKSRRRDLRL